ncbi:MAG: gamma-glutamylcyclotransferase [Gammaproteobacteria bacterium]|nr:gamma-glutamylcyclotransferase [Gammaproteobacteria bacterium]
MLRVILWKLGSEWAQIKRILAPGTGRKIYYFAFGANLCQTVLDLRRITVFEAFDFVLDDAVLRFSQSGFYKDHGYASADAAGGEVVYGRMYLILERDAERMDYYEGVPFLGAHEKVFREADEFKYFFYRATSISDGLKPTREYLDYLVTAYRQMPNVPQTYTESIAATEVLEYFIPSDQTGEFVKDLNRWPSFMRPLLIYYEGICLRLIELLWNRSLFKWMIKSSNKVNPGH